MMNPNRCVLFASALTFCPLVFADPAVSETLPPASSVPPPTPYYAPPQPTYHPPLQYPPIRTLRPFRADPAFTLLDIFVYRPLGTVVTVVGLGLFAGASPLIGLASIPQPHDAFPQAFDILVTVPAAYTFVRPLGERSLPYPNIPHY